jgi:tetratricopeptide (TPR) repeat protein
MKRIKAKNTERTKAQVKSNDCLNQIATTQDHIEDLKSLSINQQFQELSLKLTIFANQNSNNPLAWKALGKSQLMEGKFEESAFSLQKALAILPNDVDGLCDLGMAYTHLESALQAEACFKQAISLEPSNELLHCNLGNLLYKSGKREQALEVYLKALSINSQNAIVHNNIGRIYFDSEKINAAREHFNQALLIDNKYYQAWINQGRTLAELTRTEESEQCYRQALALAPQSTVALHCLSFMLIQQGSTEKYDEAITLLKLLLEIEPKHTDALIGLGNVLMKKGCTSEALQFFQKAKKLKTFTTWSATLPKLPFSAVLLDSPFAASIPVHYLLGKANYDRNIYCLLPSDTSNHVEEINHSSAILINLLGDVDHGLEMLQVALEICKKVNRPVINHPQMVMQTDRVRIAEILTDIKHCRTAKTIRIKENDIGVQLLPHNANDLSSPQLIRMAGTHGGESLCLCNNLSEIKNYIQNNRAPSYYLSEFINYQSPDGYYRKYRWICIDQKIYPYHLAIHKDWLVHYFRTDMANHEWMLNEERDFIATPLKIFKPHHIKALEEVAKRIKLDYFGIDCGINEQDAIIIFEANATMLVHDEKSEPFIFKNEGIHKIKHAFDTMITFRALEKR